MEKTNMEVGKTAERIVEDLFKEAGFKVIRYGYEYTVPQLADRNNLIQGEAADYIRHQPDLIVVNKNNEAFFIEVKFRKEGIINTKHLFHYPKGYAVFLTKNSIQAQSLDWLYKKGADAVDLNRIPAFSQISSDLIKKYVNLTRRKLGDDTLLTQIGKNILEKKFNIKLAEEEQKKIIFEGLKKPSANPTTPTTYRPQRNWQGRSNFRRGNSFRRGNNFRRR